VNCPSCQESLIASARSCPQCGARIARLETAVLKTSAVLVARGETTAVFSSVKEIPEPLRTQLVRVTTGPNSGTLVIADRRGKEEIERAAKLELARRETTDPERKSGVNWRRAVPVLVSALIVGAGAWLALHRW
jgi:hypothetical protein